MCCARLGSRVGLLPRMVLTLTALILAVIGPAAGNPAEKAPPPVADSRCADAAQPIGVTPADESEPALVATPDGRRLLATWTRHPRAGGVRTGSQPRVQGEIVLAQRDPRGNWSEEPLASWGFDPWIDVSPRGVAYGSAITDSGVLVYSVVPGRSPKQLGVPKGGGDHPALAVDQRQTWSAGPRPDRLYLVGTHLEGFGPPAPGVLETSRDGGSSWGSPIPFPPHHPDYIDAQLAPAVASGGETVVVAWLEWTGPWTTDVRTAIRVAPVDPRTRAIGAATTFPAMPGEWGGLPLGAKALPSLAVVRGGPREGRAYVAWSHRRDASTADALDVLVSYSDDHGKTWSSPRRVNDDDGAGNFHVFPSVAALPSGDAFVAWMDNRDYPKEEKALLYGARVGVEGHVEPNRRLTECPTTGGVLGDYFNSGVAGGKPVILFPNVREGKRDSDLFLLEGWGSRGD